MTIDLTEAQRAVLAPAVTRDDRCIYPVTANLKGGAVGNVAKSLLKRELIEEVAAGDDHSVWRIGDDGTALTLRATDLGACTIGGDGPGTPVQACAPAAPETPQAPPTRRGFAQQALLDLLRQPEGASIAEMQAATGWQPHSVRGALSGVIAKKLGHTVASEKEAERGRVYRIAG